MMTLMAKGLDSYFPLWKNIHRDRLGGLEFGDYLRAAAEALHVVVRFTGSGLGNRQGGWEGVRGHRRGSRSNAGGTHTAQKLGGGPVGRSAAPGWGNVVAVVWSLSRFQLFATSWTASFTISWSLLRFMGHTHLGPGGGHPAGPAPLGGRGVAV